ncbi:MAG TPA: hypothetical protein VGF76_26515, partial [Polyangiaceae bacterium]
MSAEAGRFPGPRAASRLPGGALRCGSNRRPPGSTLAFLAMASALAPGLLLAAPPLADPNFERSVVLLS